jgi:non-ribosomal peptide synthetase component E (peptide arylation enzyme)
MWIIGLKYLDFIVLNVPSHLEQSILFFSAVEIPISPILAEFHSETAEIGRFQ